MHQAAGRTVLRRARQKSEADRFLPASALSSPEAQVTRFAKLSGNLLGDGRAHWTVPSSKEAKTQVLSEQGRREREAPIVPRARFQHRRRTCSMLIWMFFC